MSEAAGEAHTGAIVTGNPGLGRPVQHNSSPQASLQVVRFRSLMVMFRQILFFRPTLTPIHRVSFACPGAGAMSGRVCLRGFRQAMLHPQRLEDQVMGFLVLRRPCCKMGLQQSLAHRGCLGTGGVPMKRVLETQALAKIRSVPLVGMGKERKVLLVALGKKRALERALERALPAR